MPSNSYTSPGWHTFNVPSGVKSVTVVVNGAGSGSRPGGRVTGRIAVTGSQNLKILVGEAGNAPSGKTGGAATVGGGGRGGSAGTTGTGGRSGGGASYIRVNSSTGTVRCVAGGAGGDSGDSGAGGMGGGAVGENGFPGSSGALPTGNAVGGSQTQGGKGGTSTSGTAFDGATASNATLGAGGAGGSAAAFPSHGGGGGGGGYRSGGGGQASATGYTPGGGGGGGSNYTGGMTFGTNEQGAGGTGNGSVTITWTSAPPANQPPSPPSQAKVNGTAESDGMATKSTGKVTITAELDDSSANQRVRMIARYSTSPTFSNARSVTSKYVAQEHRATVELTGLLQNTHYYVRLYSEDEKGKNSTTYNSLNFWTNRKPVAALVTPAANTQFSSGINMTFDWTFTDPDPNSSQKAFQLRVRPAPTLDEPAGAWIVYSGTTSSSIYTIAGNTFRSNTFYEWTVRVQDAQGLWGDWADAFSFYATGLSSPPRNLEPFADAAIDVTLPQLFKWSFRDPQPDDQQCKADLRYRVVGTENWVTLFGGLVTPGPTGEWMFPVDQFAPGYRYEWQARTYDGGPTCSSMVVSEWSDSATFWTTGAPGAAADQPIVSSLVDVQSSLGVGTHRVFIYDRGGKVLRGEITPMTHVVWGRKRDDISSALVTTNGFGEDCCQLLSDLRSWMHEIVVYRDGERVFEGPITRITYKVNEVEIEAKDVMAYVYRRIMRQGYNDSYRLVNGEQLGLRSVVERARIITMNALAPDDPNVLPYLTVLNSGTDAKQSRVRPDFSSTAWEEIDDLAATAGLDYTVVGRRIIYWDTHRSLGRLPEMRDGDFSDPPVVTEYGMLLANFFAVTNNNGIAGGVFATLPDPTVEDPERTRPAPEDFYGRVEQLASAYGEAAAAAEETLTAAARDALANTMRGQAARNMIGRFPTPLIVRVPDNSSLNPEINVGINQLVPGVWIPLRSDATCREVAQWQKLDSLTVEQDDDGEKVKVVLSPAPQDERDPDADSAALEEE